MLARAPLRALEDLKSFTDLFNEVLLVGSCFGMVEFRGINGFTKPR